MPFVYIGRRHSFVGKSLWEIVGSLKDFGVGRLVYRNRFTRYTEPCFMRIVTAKPLMDEDNRKGKLEVEQVFRGHNMGVIDLSRVAYKTDYRLVPKHEEHLFIKEFENFEEKSIKLFTPTVEMPPLMKLAAQKKGHHATVFTMTMKTENNPRARIAREGEIPNTVVTPSLGTPVCKHLYEGVLDNPGTQ